MKKKCLLTALCALMCMSVTACDLSALLGGVSSSSVQTATESEAENETNSVEDGSSVSEEEVSKDSMGESDSTSDKDSESSSEIMSGPDTPAPPEYSTPEDSTPEDGGDEIPEWQMQVTVYFYTIQYNEEPLIYRGLVDKDATLKDFFNAYMGGMVALYNTAHGFTEDDGYYYDANFMKAGFWQVGGHLMYENSRLAENPANVTEVNMVFTPSGAGMNIGICDCGDPMNCYAYATIPFPVGVYIADFVNWAYKMGIFNMTYEQSIAQGYWAEAGVGMGEPLTDEYMTGQSVLCFVSEQSDMM